MSLNHSDITILGATSAEINPTFVVIYWKPVRGVKGYNIYRSGANKPLNGDKLISSVKTCEELEVFVPKDSPEWEMLVNAFTSMAMRDDASHLPVTQIGIMRQGSVPVDLCLEFKNGLTSLEERIFDTLANINLKIRLARGLGYIDNNVEVGKEYFYELRGVKLDGSEILLAQTKTIRAGQVDFPNYPSGLKLYAGDSKVLMTWNRNPAAFSYMVRRAKTPNDSSSWQIINDEPIFYDITQDLQGKPIKGTPGFLDFQRWDDDGNPTFHIVQNLKIAGPENGVTYYYEVASCDILNRAGQWSNYQLALPIAQTPPMTPGDFKIDTLVENSANRQTGLALSWRRVRKNINNHNIIDQRYDIYRADALNKLENLETLADYYVGTRMVNSNDTETVNWLDTDPTLIPPYGEKTFWYRVRCIDANNNVSSPSVALSGKIPDMRPPGPTKMIGSKGFADHITIFWAQNQEPDLAGYQVYRYICDKGVFFRGQNTDYPCDFVLIGGISAKDADERLEQTGTIYYEDYSVPEGAPICYAYWVRAYDVAQNIYAGNHGCPASRDEYICQRLHENIPPEVPIIIGLKAKNNSILIEWIASPVQDLRAFHVYRSDEENGTPEFVGCVLNTGQLWPGKWTGINPKCEDIPAVLDPILARGSLLDTKVEPDRIYWYRVSALDWLGNESEGKDIRKIPAVSSFTYSTDLPIAPTVLAQEEPAKESCGLVIRWNPLFDPIKLQGFFVFRSTSEKGLYRQVSPMVKGNRFSDKSAFRGNCYWYCVQAMNKSGRLSESSKPVKHNY